MRIQNFRPYCFSKLRRRRCYFSFYFSSEYKIACFTFRSGGLVREIGRLGNGSKVKKKVSRKSLIRLRLVSAGVSQRRQSFIRLSAIRPNSRQPYRLLSNLHVVCKGYQNYRIFSPKKFLSSFIFATFLLFLPSLSFRVDSWSFILPDKLK